MLPARQFLTFVTTPSTCQSWGQKVEQTGWDAFDKSGGQIFPLIDRFLKGSARFNPIELVSARRRVPRSFRFSDGAEASPGQCICFAPKVMNRNPYIWPKVDEFYGFRFVKPEILEQPARSHDTLAWAVSQEETFLIPQDGKSTFYIDLTD